MFAAMCALKNAGAFWVTIDLFFDGHNNYLRYSQSEALGPAAIAGLYGWIQRE